MKNLTKKLISRNKKSIAVLIDPDKVENLSGLEDLISRANSNKVDAIFIGGSLVTNDDIDTLVKFVKQKFYGQVVLFPGGVNQISGFADGILFLNLISGRNPEFLIGRQVVGAPLVNKLRLDVYPTGYMLIGESSSASYMSNTKPIPYEEVEIAKATAMAGAMMGNHLIFMDAGSGANQPVAEEMIRSVRENIDLPLIVGGGIRNFDQAMNALEAGADMIVVGNVLEKEPHLIQELSGAVRGLNDLHVH